MNPTRNNVLVVRKDPILTTESGIILKNPIDVDRAIVKAIGPDVTEVSVNDEVMLDWNKAIDIDDGTYIIPVTEIVMILE